MDWLTALILGIIQGLTEFLPVSSSGHLEMAKVILGSDALPEQSMLMTVVLHFATALSTVVIFRREIVQIIRGILQFKWNDEMKFSVYIVLSMVPAALIGIAFEEEIEAFFGGRMGLVGAMLLVTGVLLFFADRAKKTDKSVAGFSAIIIGISQAIAILPGISRSGATISTSVLLGIDREKSARFSFLMVVPLIFGKMGKDVMSDEFAVVTGETLPLIIGFIAAFITGLIACKWMIALVRRAKLSYFSVYCFLVGIGAIVYSVL